MISFASRTLLKTTATSLFFFLFLALGQAKGQQAPDLLQQMSTSFETLVTRVAPSVVEIFVAGYGAPEEDEDSEEPPSNALERQRSQGSGVIVDPDGYILTNFHVVKGAQRISVVITPPPSQGAQAPAMLRTRGRILKAKIVGVSKTADLAVLKVEAKNLPALPIAKYQQLRQGQLVLAFGSPQGLQNSVSMGLVSSVLRQLDTDSAMVYIQTDAAINPGNSGGPLVDTEGRVVGINSSILTQSGGNEGIGFAIPGSIAGFVYDQVRKYGYVRRGFIGADVQTVTPELATALSIPQGAGVIVSDIYPGSSAEAAGLRISDIIQSLNGTPVDSVPTYTMDLFLLTSGDKIDVTVLRGAQKLSLLIPVIEGKQDTNSLADLADFDKGVVPQLGSIISDLTPEVDRLIPQPRIHSGVIILAVTTDHRADEVGVRAGDIIHSLNGKPIADVASLKASLEKLKPGDPAALQIERDGRLSFVSFEIE